MLPFYGASGIRYWVPFFQLDLVLSKKAIQIGICCRDLSKLISSCLTVSASDRPDILEVARLAASQMLLCLDDVFRMHVSKAKTSKESTKTNQKMYVRVFVALFDSVLLLKKLNNAPAEDCGSRWGQQLNIQRGYVAGLFIEFVDGNAGPSEGSRPTWCH